MKIKAAYYIRQLPTKIAVTTVEGRTMITDLVPARKVKPEELESLPAFDNGIWKPEKVCDPIPQYSWLALYGFTLAEK